MKTDDIRDEWRGWEGLPHYKEGNTSKYPNYQLFLFELIRDLRPDNILEIGFNAGHSACCFLNAAPGASLVTFDICRHGTEWPAYEELDKYFDINLIEGDSIEEVPKYLANSPEVYFDLIFIDGNHSGEHPYYDIKNTIDRLNKDGIFIIDDMGTLDVRRAVEKFNWDDFEEITNIPNKEKNARPKILRKVN